MVPDDRSPESARDARVDPASEALSTTDAADAGIRQLIHEIAGLVDGSLRYLRLVQRELADEEGSDEISRAYLETAADALTRVASLVQQGRGAASRYSSMTVGRRLSAGRSLRDILEHAVSVLRPLADDRGVALRVGVDLSVGAAGALPIYPVVVNGLRNAIEACGSGASVHLHASVEGEAGRRALVVEIVDTGCGLPEEAARVFEPGFTTKGTGSGIGLPLARDIVHDLRGTIDLGPNPGGPGARLVFRVPLAEEADNR